MRTAQHPTFSNLLYISIFCLKVSITHLHLLTTYFSILGLEKRTQNLNNNKLTSIQYLHSKLLKVKDIHVMRDASACTHKAKKPQV